jgi:uncharacterized membrane protein YphA (DoxX/SURF4 family)
MNDSMAHPSASLVSLELPGWKTALNWFSSISISLLFLISGLWKITDVQSAAVRMAQARVPESLSLVVALVVGIAETVGGVYVLVPRFRRWGALLTALLLVVFMVYTGWNYQALRGADCSCFPWLKRLVGPGFFAGDALMLGLAICAGAWSKRPGGLRSAMLICGAVVVFALVSYGAVTVRHTGVRAPDAITVDGHPYSLDRGKYFLFFFHPECMHCMDAARRMSHLAWGETRVVAIPVEQPQFSAAFLNESGLRAMVTSDFQKLKRVFGYKTYPFGVALENGRERAPLTRFEGDEPATTLKRLGLVD